MRPKIPMNVINVCYIITWEEGRRCLDNLFGCLGSRVEDRDERMLGRGIVDLADTARTERSKDRQPVVRR